MNQTLDPCACSIARRTSRALTQMYDRMLEPSGLLSTQYSLLRKLDSGGKSISDLAEQLHLDRTTLTRNLRVLESGRFVRLEVGDDRRERCATLTAKGRRALEAAIPLWKNAQTALKKHLGSERYGQFLALLDYVEAIEN